MYLCGTGVALYGPTNGRIGTGRQMDTIMSEYISSLITQLLVCLTGLIICVATQLQAHAAGGDIIISREVQPRAAARQELVPDPTPLVANPDRSAQVNSSLRAV